MVVLINILLIDDHLLFARSMEIALGDFPQIQSFQSVEKIADIMPILKNKRIDVVLLDINLGDLLDEDGLALAKTILQELPATKILMLTGYDLPVYRHEAEKIGVRGFVNKSIEPDQLIGILEKIDRGEYYFGSEGSGYIEELTETEKNILQLLSDGLKRRDIALKLFISERTVSNHLQHIFEKLQVSSALEAVAKGLRLGYIKTKF